MRPTVHYRTMIIKRSLSSMCPIFCCTCSFDNEQGAENAGVANSGVEMKE